MSASTCLYGLYRGVEYMMRQRSPANGDSETSKLQQPIHIDTIIHNHHREVLSSTTRSWDDHVRVINLHQCKGSVKILVIIIITITIIITIIISKTMDSQPANSLKFQLLTSFACLYTLLHCTACHHPAKASFPSVVCKGMHCLQCLSKNRKLCNIGKEMQVITDIISSTFVKFLSAASAMRKNSYLQSATYNLHYGL